MSPTEAGAVHLKLNLDCDEVERKLKALKRDVVIIGLAARLTVAIIFGCAFVLGLAVGLVVGR